MSRLPFLVIFLLAVVSCKTTPETVVTIHVKDGSADVDIQLYVPDSTYKVTLDSTGSASVKLADGINAEYGELRYGRTGLLLYIQPGKSFDVSLDFEGKKMIPEFTGEGAGINVFLNKRHGGDLDFKAEEAQFIQSLEEMEKNQFANLDTLGFAPEFVAIEKNRLHYLFYKALAIYPSYHAYYTKNENFQPSPVYYDLLRSQIKEDESLLKLDEYKNTLSSCIQVYSTKDIEDRDALVNLEATLKYVDRNISNQKIASFLVDKFVADYLYRSSVGNFDEIISTYDAKVTSPEQRAKSNWLKLAKGQPSIPFKYLDINDNEVSLADLVGKYVYIDIWRTSCGPCRNELRVLKELENNYKDKNIVFVSISFDPDKELWKKTVTDEAFGGIQLHNGGDYEFTWGFMVRTIPRFILLDKEGHIIRADMTRPSNPETIQMFESLEGI